jgi:Ca-activated chloride channel family protein
VQTALGRQIVNPSKDLDEKTLASVAELTGGRYFRAQDVKSLAGIYALLDELEPSSGDPVYIRPSVSLFFWPLSGALALTILLALSLVVPPVAGWFEQKPSYVEQ